MKRTDFTVKIAELILWISHQGWYAILDYGLRSEEEQQRLFKAGKSKCDGIQKKSQHQRGLAEDIYIHDGDNNIEKRELYEKAHQFWETLGGEPMISWDQGHFEGRSIDPIIPGP
jgi:uncharacterized protein YcbK (DUF882 family)